MTLYLMRHGEASFDAVTDEERELTSLGEEQSLSMGKMLAEKEINLVLVSPYVRAQQTWQQVQTTWKSSATLHTLEDLQPSTHTEEAALVIQAYAEKEQANNVLVISHMPLLGEIVCEFAPHISPTMLIPSTVIELDDWHVGHAKTMKTHLPQ